MTRRSRATSSSAFISNNPIAVTPEPAHSGEVLTPPTFDSMGAYGARLGDADFWSPDVEAALARSGLASTPCSPRVITTGSLFPDDENAWPFMITERLSGQAWREVSLPSATAAAIATDLG